VGLEALGGRKTINQIAQEYGVHPVQIGQWKREIQAQVVDDNYRGRLTTTMLAG
jgi:transposase-like protein